MAGSKKIVRGSKKEDQRKRKSTEKDQESIEEIIARERRTKRRHEKEVEVVPEEEPEAESADDADHEKEAETADDADNEATSSEEDDDDSSDDSIPCHRLPGLKMRTPPKALAHAVENLNAEQKKAVEELGFAHILKFKITAVPQKLAYWLLENMDTQSREIKLNNGRRLHFDADDVRVILGFPRGHKKLVKMKRSEPCNFVTDFRNRMGKGYNRISIADVHDETLVELDGGLWFKRLFMVLLTTCLVESSGNGYLFPQLLHYFDEVDSVREYDWCEYVVRCLVETTRNWQQHKHRYFTGPILFLVMLYVDRIELMNREIPRSVPAFEGWTFTDLVMRQSEELETGGFGGGYPCPRYSLVDYINDNPHLFAEKESTPAAKATDEPGPSNKPHSEGTHPPTTAAEYADEMMNTARIMTDAMVKLLGLIEGAPNEMFENLFFKKTSETVQNLLLRKPVSSTPPEVAAKEQSQSTQDDDDFWSNPERLAAVEKIEKALAKRAEYEKSVDDMPSFSLGIGLTQDENDDWQKVLNVARVVEESEKQSQREEEDLNEDSEKQDDVHEKTVEEETEKEKADEGSLKEKMETYNRKGKSVVEDRSHIKTRSKHLIKPSEAMMSPYISRTVDVRETMSKIEGELYFWVLNLTDEKSREEILYSDGRVMINREELQTLRPETYISYLVIDVWSTVLNHNERMRSKDSRYRFYFTTYPCNNTIVDPPKDWNATRRMNEFIKRVKGEIDAFPWVNLSEVEMFFFPIYQMNHFFLICIDLKDMESVIIDNSLAMEKEKDGLKAKYGDIPTLLIKYFVEYIKKAGLIQRSKEIKKYIPSSQRLQMPWRDETNKSDCGVYVLQHMETYMGNGGKNWKTGFKKKSPKQMRYLRMRYCTAILNSDTNILKAENAPKADFYYRDSSGDGPIDVAAMYLNKQK